MGNNIQGISTNYMTPKEKAKEIFDNMCQNIGSNCEHDSYCEEDKCKLNGTVFCKISKEEAKECAKIVCNEFIGAMSTTHIGYCKEAFNAYYKKKKYYWLAVKAEIEKM